MQDQDQLGRLRAGLSGYLSQRILKLIRDEELRPGDRLPSVKALAERFSVATPTLREALRRLQASGVIEIRHGSGLYVRNDQERIVFANPGLGEIDPDVLLNLLEARALIEPRLAELTARNATAETVAELEQKLKNAERHLGTNDKLLHEANMGFHRLIAGFSGNTILAQVIESLIELYLSEQLLILELYKDRPRDHQEHWAIFEAISKGDARRARELMRQHIWDVRAVVQARLQETNTTERARNAGAEY
jgi:GntR family transcriptional regulator, transcriptional repressor for pyruvate dehydrogenase complex